MMESWALYIDCLVGKGKTECLGHYYSDGVGVIFLALRTELDIGLWMYRTV